MNLESIIRTRLLYGLVAFCLLFYAGTAAAESTTAADGKSLDDEIQALKQEVISLNQDLFILEEELLFPSSTPAGRVRVTRYRRILCAGFRAVES